ncbi:proteasome subunit beta type-3 [Bactrocera oleae]|uniref:proteasome subunit beta type-3 n=1 Tax=Bactrocera oleae TaxID=104688 RepID=UPI0006B76508|nr:proteasome subunit beta type-3 [Bactrocera oleae]
MSIMAYNGGCLVAMRGKNCVAIATDHRFGIQAQTISTDFEKVFQINPRTFLGLVGLQTDILTVHDRIMFRKKLYEDRENREMTPEPFSAMISNFLYEHRFGPYFIEPVIAGLHPKTLEPFICNMDLIGCPNKPDDFVVAGTCSEQLYGMCETLWKEDLEPAELSEVISQAIVSAFDRDAISGWGATVYIIEKDKITKKQIKTRMD